MRTEPWLCFACALAVPAVAQADPAGAESEVASTAQGAATTQEREQLLVSGELQFGFSDRLSDSPAFDFEESVDMSLGFSGWVEPSRVLAAGFGYDRVGLGGSHTDAFPGTSRALYDLNAFWLGLRAFPWHKDQTQLFVALRLGASFQEVEASGLQASEIGAGDSFSCSGSEGPGLGLGGGVGLRLGIGDHVLFTTEADFGAHQLSGDLIRNCAPGVGSVTHFSARFGFAYAFDLLQPARAPFAATQ